MHASIAAIEYFLPEKTVSTADLSAEFPEWSVEKIDSKTGIRDRHVVGAEECSSDLAFAAAQKLFQSGACRPEQIDFILLCTQSPDYFLPTTACLLQDRLGIPTTAGALDFNLGCSGFVYGLGLAEGLIASGQASKVLLLTAETYSKFLNPQDRECPDHIRRCRRGDPGECCRCAGAVDRAVCLRHGRQRRPEPDRARPAACGNRALRRAALRQKLRAETFAARTIST